MTYPPNLATQIKFEIAYRTALVAAIFVVVVLALLAYSYSQRMIKDPFEEPAFQKVREDLSGQRGDPQLLATLRDLDEQLRNEYFQQRRFAREGAWLLLAAMAAALAAGRWAFLLRRPPPMPAGPADPIDVDERISRYGRWAVAAVAAVIFIWAAAVAATLQSRLPCMEQELALCFPRLVAQDGDGAVAAVIPDQGTDRPPPDAAGGEPPRGPVDPTAPDYPSEEELQANWHCFRGYQGRGVSVFADPPAAWDGAAEEGILWKTAVPLPGNSSPVVWQDRVFLTGASQEKREVYRFAADSGRILWQFEAKGTPESTACRPRSSTPRATRLPPP